MSKWSGEVVAQIDMYLALTVVLLALVAMVVIQPPVTNTAQDKAICLMAIDIDWASDSPADVDLWVAPPQDHPIGYAMRESSIGTLVKDDMGNVLDDSGTNSERICLRVVSDGVYVVNLMLFDLHSGSSPVEVSVQVAAVDPASATMEPLWKGTKSLSQIKVEETVIQFTIQDGKLVPGSINSIPKDIL